MDRCNELCTKDATGHCAACEALAERDRFLRFWFGGGLFQASIQGISKGISRGCKRLANKGKIPRRWWYPGLQYQSLLFNLSNEEWKRQHDETSRSIFQVLVTIVSFSFFCILSLGAPDVSLLAGNATIKIPFANIDISFVAFLYIGPVILIALTIYLHVFVGYHSILSASQNGRGLPYIFNLQSRLARYVSGMLLYWLVPYILFVFSYKAAPRLGSNRLVIITVAVTIVLVWVKIRRWSSSQRRNRYRSLWLIEGVLVYILVLQLGNSSSLLTRPLNLFHANLEAQDLEAINLRRALLVKANLRQANLQRANLQQAFLQGADLRDANLWEAELQHAELWGADLQGAFLRQAFLQGANLQGANLQEADLQGADFRQAKLQGANLTKVNNLTQDQVHTPRSRTLTEPIDFIH